ncbi:hypothetical protein [Marinibacterium profundimaris]|uniref:Uncharacterized protein n=1 Tax=Marinibacterium profundimaris TaxID=1679460 RepID=A0A225NSZ5_9RHOB|nr:hypothetical protein [Marinibacterium profundimaris]OWU77965.1 hypothetical protein ATO3_04875 [Marinibacterium profundimaris]
MTASRKARGLVTIMMAITGAAFFFGFLTEELGHVTPEQAQSVPQELIIRYIVAMAIGGALSGLVCAGLFGRHGVGGWVLGLLGAVLASLLAGLIGSAIGQVPDMAAGGFNMTEVISIAFGLVLIPLAMAGRPVMIAVWAVLMVVTHLLARRARGHD